MKQNGKMGRAAVRVFDNRRCKKFAGSLALIACALVPVLPSAAEDVAKHEMQVAKGDSCKVCGMYIEVYRDTAGEVVLEDGQRELYCGVACTLRSINENLGLPHVKSAYVTDWDTHAPVPLEKSVLVVNSDLTPDMVPNYIAFRSAESAEAFRKEHGGSTIDLERALSSISYQGMTMPFRVTPAATPPAGIFSVGFMASYMLKDHLLTGDHSRSLRDVLATRPMMGKRMQATMATTSVGYALTDDFWSDLMIPYAWKRMTSQRANGQRMTFEEEGLGDLALSGRWRFYHDELYDKHLAVVLRTTLPTGDFSNEHRDRPGLQGGTGALGLGGGLLYSQHIGLFWLHTGVEYLTNLENSDDYKFGDVAKAGVALHYTPSTSTMIGVEFDGVKTMENQSFGHKLPNSGSEGAFANLVGQQRLAMFWGGNFDIRGMIGVPVYQYVEGTQLGETLRVGVGVQWKRRF
jgi:nitrous oxide reductase accessory protein NosL